MDLLPQVHLYTNLSHPQPLLQPGPQSTPDFIDSPIDRILDSTSSTQINIDLINRFIDSSTVSLNLKALTQSLQHASELQFYTDGSLQKDPTLIDSMGIS